MFHQKHRAKYLPARIPLRMIQKGIFCHHGSLHTQEVYMYYQCCQLVPTGSPLNAAG